MISIQIMRIRYPDIHIPQWKGSKLRGFFSNMDRDDPLLHQHLTAGKVAYQYPLIQYKVIRQHPMVVAAGDGIRHIYPHVLQNDFLYLDGFRYPCGRREIELGEEWLGESRGTLHYRFLSPWFGLNQENFTRYMDLNTPDAKNQLLSKILIGNILSMAKRFGITVGKRLIVLPHLLERRDRFKGETILSFYGGFEVNFRLPNYLALGKSVSRGYGTYIQIRNAGGSDS